VIPLYLAFTENEPENRPRIALTAAISVAIVMVLCVFAGSKILDFFGITIPGFRIAGGILLFMVALNMLNARVSRVKHTESEGKEALESESVGVIPLAIPLTAGPGTISTVVLLSQDNPDVTGKLTLVAACLSIAFVIWVSFRLGLQISRAIGKTGMNIFTRVMGLILAAVAVEFIVGGIRAALPGLA
jgi:membrane protein, MarC family